MSGMCVVEETLTLFEAMASRMELSAVVGTVTVAPTVGIGVGVSGGRVLSPVEVGRLVPVGDAVAIARLV